MMTKGAHCKGSAHSAHVRFFLPPTWAIPLSAVTTSSSHQNQIPSTMATISSPNFRLLINAFDDYAKEVGEDLTKNPLADALRACDSPNAVLELLQEKAHAFKEYRDGDHKLIGYLKPVVQVVQGFSGFLGDAISFVSQILDSSSFPFSLIYH